MTFGHYVEVLLIVLIFLVIVGHNRKKQWREDFKLYNLEREFKKYPDYRRLYHPDPNRFNNREWFNLHFFMSYVLMFTCFIAIVYYYLALLQTVNPTNDLTLCLAKDVLDQPVDTIVEKVRNWWFDRKFTPGYPDLAERIVIAQWKIHVAFLKSLVFLGFLFIFDEIVVFITFYWHAMYSIVFIGLVIYHGIYPDYCILESAAGIMDTSNWSGKYLSPDMLTKHQVLIEHTKYSLCKYYSVEDILKIAEYMFKDELRQFIWDYLHMRLDTMPYDLNHPGDHYKDDKYRNPDEIFDFIWPEMKELLKEQILNYDPERATFKIRLNNFKSIGVAIEKCIKLVLSDANLRKCIGRYILSIQEQAEKDKKRRGIRFWFK